MRTIIAMLIGALGATLEITQPALAFFWDTLAQVWTQIAVPYPLLTFLGVLYFVALIHFARWAHEPNRF